MSIMNMPPLPFLARIPGIDAEKLRAAFTDASVWDGFEIAKVTLVMVLVSGDSAAWVKRPETQDEVFARDIIPDHLAAVGGTA